MGRSKTVFILLCLAGALSFAQEGEVFAPFVTRLEAEVKNNFIRLSWTDSADVKGPVFVYRSDAPFTGLQAASLPRPAEVPYGSGSFLDEADQIGTIYYFVAASDEWDRKYALSIPYTNTVTVEINRENVAAFFRDAPPASPGVVSSYTPEGTIRSISAKIDGARVILSYEGGTQANAILYRSVNPILTQNDLLQAVIVKQRISSPFIDYPVPGINYYYAVIYENELGMAAIRQGENATTAPVKITANTPVKAAEDNPRSIPLPQITLNTLPGAVPLGPEAARTASTLEPRSGTAEKKTPVILPSDLEPGAGEEFQLRSIVQGYFALGDWKAAGEELHNFLALRRSPQQTARANFYLGQARYFTGDYRESLFALLAAQDLFPVETAPWIQAVLGQMID
jgi:hypothetical protein